MSHQPKSLEEKLKEDLKDLEFAAMYLKGFVDDAERRTQIATAELKAKIEWLLDGFREMASWNEGESAERCRQYAKDCLSGWSIEDKNKYMEKITVSDFVDANLEEYPTLQCRLVPIDEAPMDGGYVSVVCEDDHGVEVRLASYKTEWVDNGWYDNRDILYPDYFLQFYNGKEWVTEFPKVEKMNEKVSKLNKVF